MLLVLAAAKQVGLRCSQGFARSTGDVRQPGRLVSGGYPGRRLVFPSIIYWFKVSFLRGSPSAFDAWWHANNPAFGGYNMSTGVKAHVAGSCGCKAGWFEMFPRLCKVDRDVRQPGRLVSGGYPGRRLVFPSIIYWFKVSFLRGSPSAFDAWWHANNPLLGATTCPLV